MREYLIDHPVGMLPAERIEASSVPGERVDEHKIALVIEGGGMRERAMGNLAGLGSHPVENR